MLELIFSFMVAAQAETLYPCPGDAVRLTVYDGPPIELASLVPDEQKRPARWLFPAKKERPIYVSCEYKNAQEFKTTELPREVTDCREKWKGKKLLGLSCI